MFKDVGWVVRELGDLCRTGCCMTWKDGDGWWCMSSLQSRVRELWWNLCDFWGNRCSVRDKVVQVSDNSLVCVSYH